MQTPKTKLTAAEAHAARIGATSASKGMSESDNPYMSASMRDLSDAWLRGFNWYFKLKAYTPPKLSIAGSIIEVTV